MTKFTSDWRNFEANWTPQFGFFKTQIGTPLEKLHEFNKAKNE